MAVFFCNGVLRCSVQIRKRWVGHAGRIGYKITECMFFVIKPKAQILFWRRSVDEMKLLNSVLIKHSERERESPDCTEAPAEVFLQALKENSVH